MLRIVRSVLVVAALVTAAVAPALAEAPAVGANRQNADAANPWTSLPFHWAITTRRGAGRRQIAVFSDPNCGYCRRFESDLARLDDITIHVFMFPILRPESVRQSKAVWCSRNRQRAWNDLLQKRIEPLGVGPCATPIADLLMFGRWLGARATPTWFLPDGRRGSGAMRMADIEPLLDEALLARRQ